MYVCMNITVLDMGSLLVSGIWQLGEVLPTDVMKLPATVILSLLYIEEEYLEEEGTKYFETLVMSINIRNIRNQ